MASATAFGSSSASLFSAHGIGLVVITIKNASILRIVRRYFYSSGSRALKLFSMWPEITCESVLIIACLADSAQSFVNARMTAS
jgi:hypothetical protein